MSKYLDFTGLSYLTNKIKTLINTKADKNHTHDYLPLTGGMINGELSLSTYHAFRARHVDGSLDGYNGELFLNHNNPNSAVLFGNQGHCITNNGSYYTGTSANADAIGGCHEYDLQKNIRIHEKINLTSGTFYDCILNKINEGFRGGKIELNNYCPSDTCNGNYWGFIEWTCNENKFAHLIFYSDRWEVLHVREISYGEEIDTGWHRIGEGCNSDTLDGYHVDSFVKLNYAATTNWDTITDGGMYRMDDITTQPSNIFGMSSYGQLLVIRGYADTVTQIYCNYNDNQIFSRSANGVGTATVNWTPWDRFYSSRNITYGTDNMYPGSSGLATGNIYLQYE
jgi:hypothetical protein